jgi:hypothetical protein
MTAQAKQRLVFVLGFLFAAFSGIALADRDTVIVDCARGRGIQDALGKKNPDRPLEVVIRGACAENITVTRDDVTLVGEGGTVNGTISIVGARRVLIRSLMVSSPTGAGIFRHRQRRVHGRGFHYRAQRHRGGHGAQQRSRHAKAQSPR